MNWLFRRHFWILHLMFLSITSVVAAKTFTSVFGYWVSKSIPEKPIASTFDPGELEPVIPDFSVANERNLFAARRERVSLVDSEDLENESDPGNWQDAGPTTLPLKLISTLVFTDPFSSRAVILNTTTSENKVYSLLVCDEYHKLNDPKIETYIPSKAWELSRPCSDIDGMATLKRIEEYRIYVFNERDRKYEYISLLEGDVGPIREKPVLGDVVEEGAGVRKVGENSYEIDQGEFDKALTNVARLMTEARAVPEKDASGNFIGFKIVYLKEGSLFEKIGIQRSDVLTRINGFDLNSPEKALQVFSKLRAASQFTIDLQRSERPVTLDYSVVR